MSVEQFVLQALNGLAIGSLLFILAAGLSLVFGMMDVANLAHGAFYMLGGYLAYTIVRGSTSACFRASIDFWIALLVVPLVMAVVGFVVAGALLRPLRGKHLEQVLLTIGVAIVLADLVRACWGGEVLSLPAPRGLDASVTVVGQPYPLYRVFLIAFGIALAIALWLVQERTKLGALIRAGVADTEMLAALGVDTERLFAFTFAAGAALAGLAGVVGTPILGLAPGIDDTVLILSLVVVVIGGMGTLSGAIVGAFIVGPANTFGALLVPEFALAFIFMVMAAVLLFRPAGLLRR
ncbi:MAG TPA: branched-chain amino acid ABC transporter permease [Candidatus Dormibacteraeota bacterium]|nr:branched-chain amino acid ABC transporter permease [Candidatus Dormibacteraeota bacterium]